MPSSIKQVVPGFRNFPCVVWQQFTGVARRLQAERVQVDGGAAEDCPRSGTLFVSL